jgi:hypothetical protein
MGWVEDVLTLSLVMPANSTISKVAMMKNFSLNERHIVRAEFKPAL